MIKDKYEVVVLKDKILHYLDEQSNKKAYTEDCYRDLGLKIEMDIFKAYILEMRDEENIKYTTSKNCSEIGITLKGALLIKEKGGYEKQYKDELDRRTKEDILSEENKEKIKLEIQNLKCYRIFAIIAILISLASLIIAIFK